MSPEQKQVNIAYDYVTNLYRNTTVVTDDPQPLFVLPRDTIRTFLHEKMSLFGIQSKLAGLVGVAVAIGVALATTEKWRGLWLIDGSVVQAAFILCFLGVALVTLITANRWRRERQNLNVDSLTDDLGSRGGRTVLTKEDSETVARKMGEQISAALESAFLDAVHRGAKLPGQD